MFSEQVRYHQQSCSSRWATSAASQKVRRGEMTVDTKVHEAIGELSSVLDTQERASQNGDQLRKLSVRLARVMDEPEQFTEAVREVLGADRVGTFRDLVLNASELSEAISKVTATPAPEVGELADSLRGLVSWLDEDAKVEVDGVLARWDALRPRRERTGASSKPDLGYTVTVRCDEHGVVASTQKQNVNSLRDAVRTHHGKEHGVKFGRGDGVFVEVTEAIKAVMNGKQQASGGGYTVLKNGGLRAA